VSPDDRPLVSVVVPVAHGGTLLAKALTSLARLDTAPEEVEVLVAGSIAEPEARDTVERLARDGRCRQVDDSDDALSVRLNRAAAAARGRVLVFLDDDCTAPPDWLSVLGEILAERPDAGIVGGRDELAGTDRAFDVALDHVLTSPLALGLFRRRGDPPPKLWNMAVPREAAEAVRARDGFLFRESLDVHQDVDLSERIRRTGRAVVHAPGWIVHHRRETTLRSCLARNRRMARAGRRHGLQRRAQRRARVRARLRARPRGARGPLPCITALRARPGGARRGRALRRRVVPNAPTHRGAVGAGPAPRDRGRARGRPRSRVMAVHG
jgi:GT2 family glycosyltransferase